jgi:hypothetical protein
MYKAGVNPAGAKSLALHVGGKGHGLPKKACDSCQAVLGHLGIEFNEPHETALKVFAEIVE